ncbi:MAG TPA: Gfo/Idh/MocA family oxidoreductase [Acidimicrobiales bacterium]|nr:Gfo/Idh/MocA family oxidoreductase [Acidimicrobiales bacterium]
MAAVVVSSSLADRRRARLASLLPAGAEVRWTGPADPLPGLGGATAVVVDGPPLDRSAADIDALAQAVRGGAVLLAIGAATPAGAVPVWDALLGAAAAGPAGPAGEYVARVDPEEAGITARLGPDIAVADRLLPLVAEGAARVLASVGFGAVAAVVEVARGAGWVVATGLGTTDAALDAADLVTLFRRALRPRPTRPPRPSTLAVVGYGPYGGMGRYHGSAAEATPGLAFVATCDHSDERRKAAEHDFPGVRAYADPGELAADDEVDVVVVATPPVLHADLVLTMLRAGKHVVCEKPLCLTVADADRLLAAAAAAGRTLTVHQNRRFDADFLAVRAAVESGRLGEVFNVETFVGDFAHPCRAWHSELAVSGGVVYDWGSHHLDWVLELLGGTPATVQAHGHKRLWHDVSNLDQVRVRLLWDDGREAEFFQSDLAAVRRPKFFVQGTAGTLVGHYRTVTVERVEPPFGYRAETAHHAEAPADLLLADYQAGSGITETRPALPRVAPFPFHRNLADHLQLGEPAAVTADSARRLVSVLEAAQRSTDGGNAPVHLIPGPTGD